LTFGRDSLDESQLVGSQLQSILVHNVNNRTIEVVTIGPGDGVASVKGGILEMNLGLDIQPDVLVWIVERVDCAPRQAWKRWARVLSSYQGLLLRWEDPRSSDPKEFPSIWEPGELARFLAEAPAPAGSTAWARARDDFAGLYRAQIRDSSDVGLLLAPRSAPPELTAAIQEVAERCQARHVKLLAVPLPHPLEFDSELRALSVASMQGMQGQDPSVGVDFETTTRLVGDLRARKVPAIDVTPVFRAAVDLKRQVLIHFKAHAWTPDAAHLTASQIAAYIFTSGALR
jgi:hypothetical protein